MIITNKAKERNLPPPNFEKYPGRGYPSDTPGNVMAKDLIRGIKKTGTRGGKGKEHQKTNKEKVFYAILFSTAKSHKIHRSNVWKNPAPPRCGIPNIGNSVRTPRLRFVRMGTYRLQF